MININDMIRFFTETKEQTSQLVVNNVALAEAAVDTEAKAAVDTEAKAAVEAETKAAVEAETLHQLQAKSDNNQEHNTHGFGFIAEGSGKTALEAVSSSRHDWETQESLTSETIQTSQFVASSSPTRLEEVSPLNFTIPLDNLFSPVPMKASSLAPQSEKIYYKLQTSSTIATDKTDSYPVNMQDSTEVLNPSELVMLRGKSRSFPESGTKKQYVELVPEKTDDNNSMIDICNIAHDQATLYPDSFSNILSYPAYETYTDKEPNMTSPYTEGESLGASRSMDSSFPSKVLGLKYPYDETTQYAKAVPEQKEYYTVSAEAFQSSDGWTDVKEFSIWSEQYEKLSPYVRQQDQSSSVKHMTHDAVFSKGHEGSLGAIRIDDSSVSVLKALNPESQYLPMDRICHNEVIENEEQTLNFDSNMISPLLTRSFTVLVKDSHAGLPEGHQDSFFLNSVPAVNQASVYDTSSYLS